jgi:NAD(P)-dependent dehydrogenase (short-subunit alcohol dehydrogenase family)
VIGAYNVSKAADLQLVRNYASEIGPDNIRINAIAPGIVKTDFARALWEDPEAHDAAARRTPLRRLGEPRDIAGAAVFLAAPASSWMTGNTIVLDGGITAWM